MTTAGRWTAWALPALCLLAPMAAIGVEAFREGRAFETLLDPAIHGLVVNTLALAGLTTLFAVLVGLPFGLLIGAFAFPLRRVLVAAAFIPLLIPHHIHTIGWMRFVGRQGWVTAWLAGEGVAMDVRAAWLPYVWPGPAWILAMALFPLVALPVADALRRADRESVAAARLLGGPRAVLAAVHLPAAKAALPGGAALVFALAAGAYAVPSLLDTPVLVQRLFFTFSQRSQGEGAMLALPLLVSAGVAAALLGDPSWRRGTLGGAARASLLPGNVGTFVLASIPVGLSVGVPLFGLVGKLVEESRRTGEGLAAFQLVWARTASSFGNGILFATLASVVLVVAAWPLARRFAAQPGSGGERALTALIAAPPVLLGVGTVLFWKWTDGAPVIGGLYRGGLLLVVLALAGRFLPIIVRVMRDGFMRLDPSAEEAARLAGASSYRRFRGVLLPMMGSTLGLAWVAGMTLALVELDVTLLTYPPGMETAQVRIFNMVHYARDAEVSALCLLVTALGLLPAIFHVLLSGGGEERHERGA